MEPIKKDIQYYKFCLYGFLKNLRFFEPFLIVFLLDEGLSFLEIGALYSVREILINIFEIPSGIIADSFGRKRSLIFSFIFYIISFLIFFFSDQYVLFMVAIIFYAFGDAFRTGTHKAMIFDYLRLNNWVDQRANYYGHTRSWSQMGSAISALIAAFIIFVSGNYKIIFIFSTVPYVLDLILISSYPNYLDGKHNNFKFDIIKDKLLKTTKNFICSFKSPDILRSVSNLSIYSGLHKSIKDYLQPVIQTFALSLTILVAYSEKQRSAILIGLIYSIIFILSSMASRYSGRFKNRIKSSHKALNITLYIGLFITLLTGLFYNYSFFAVSIIFYVGIYLVENIRNPIGVAHVSDLYNDEVLATALSANSQAKSLLAAIFAPILGLLADQFGVGIALSSLSILLIVISPLYYLKKVKTD